MRQDSAFLRGRKARSARAVLQRYGAGCTPHYFDRERRLQAGQPAVDVLLEYDTGDAKAGHFLVGDADIACGVAGEVGDDRFQRLVQVLQATLAPAGNGVEGDGGEVQIRVSLHAQLLTGLQLSRRRVTS